MKNFTNVMDEELNLIGKQLGQNEGGKKSKCTLTGLAFSGGGIRSATFNLGIIQSLAEKKLLEKFDYLSTVSGGGYIGSWLSAQIHRHTGKDDPANGVKGKQQIESFQTALSAARESGTELDSVKWLRSYSNYLTPKKGLSGDTLAAIGTWLRNTLLNQIVLGLFFALPLLSLQVAVLTFDRNGWLTPNTSSLWLWISIAFSGFAILLCAAYLPGLRCCTKGEDAVRQNDERRHPTWLIIVAATTAAYSMSLWMCSTSTMTNNWLLTDIQKTINQIALFSDVLNGLPLLADGRSPLLTAIESYWAPIYIATMWTVIYVLPWMIAILYSLLTPRFTRCSPSTADKNQCTVEQHAPSLSEFAIGTLLSAPIAGACGGYLIYLLSHAIAQQSDDQRLWWATGFGTPLLLLIFCLILVLHQGLMARLFRVSQLEWWARIGGYVMLVAVLWAGIHALLIYAPPLLDMLKSQFIATGGILWAAHSLSGVILGKGAGTSSPNKAKLRDWITRAAPYVFVLGFLVATSWAVHALMHKFGTPVTPAHLNLIVPEGQVIPHFSEFLHHALAIKNNADLKVLGYILLGGSVAFFILALRLDVNLFSIHHFYRNRLTRCYLGAGRGSGRVPNPFTGFDPCDDIRLAELRQRPLHLVNTALNLVHNDNLAWQDRKALSFTFSPIACGFEYPPNATQQGGGYCDSAQYMGGVRLGTAMAASGAAASPNMGYHSSPAVAFLLTVFNVRLGHWCPNPDAKYIWRNPVLHDSPLMGGEYLLKELFGQTDDKDDFVYLSDGGHFENLGVYELVRRRCRHIMVVDAGQDEKRTFEDAANLIRKCYIDFGVTIDIRLDALRADADGNSPSCYALGDIVYPVCGDDNNTPKCDCQGVLLYIKPSLLKDIPEDIRQYTKANDTFPHQTTGDQFFDEAQFESYRHLGKFLMDKVIETVEQQKTPGGKSWNWEAA